jgi:predicted RNase H-like nuclease (RuvC/YqgF family)
LPSYFIAGIDPGATTGVAIVGLDGKRIATASTNGGMAEAVRIIERHGTPSLISCDVFPAPEAAQKIASYFSCRLYAPSRAIREEEKRQIASEATQARGSGTVAVAAGVGTGISNNHERDAYAAAIFAHRAVANKMRQIDALAELQHEEKEKIKHLLLKGYRLTDAFAALKEPQEEKREAAKAEKVEARALSAPELRERLSFLARENSNLKMMLQRLENEKQALLHRLRLLENGVRERMFRDSEVRSLRFKLKQAMLQIGQMRRKGKKEKWKERNIPVHESKAPSDNLYKFEEKIDLEGLVAEYRKGRKL